MTKEQLQALEQLKGLSTEEVVNALEDMGEINRNLIDYEEEYYCINYDGRCFVDEYHASSTDDIIKYSKCFRTKNKQNSQSGHQQLEMKIINRIRELNAGWTPDFTNHNERKYYLYINHEENKLKSLYYCHIQFLPKELYLKSEELAQQLINELHDELIGYMTYQNWGWVEIKEEMK